MKKAEIGFSIFLMALGAFAFIVAQNYEYYSYTGIGPGFIPRWSSGLLFVGSAINLISYLSIGNKKDLPRFFPEDGPGRFLIFGVSILIYGILVVVIGMLPATAVFMVVMYRFFDKKSWLHSIIPSAGTVAFIYIVFMSLLKLRLPMGFWSW